MSHDQEDRQHCTVVVHGFHHHIRDWHHRRIARGDHSAGATTNCTSQYTSQDRADWRHPVPSPCPAFGLRLTLPQIIHGSTSTSHSRRRIIFPWHTAIQPDHITLGNPVTLYWEQIVACQRELEAPTKTVNGETPNTLFRPSDFPPLSSSKAPIRWATSC